MVVTKVHTILQTKKLSQRAKVVFAILLEDLDYQYNLSSSEGFQTFEMTPGECYSDEYFNYGSKVCLPLENQFQASTIEKDLSITSSWVLQKEPIFSPSWSQSWTVEWEYSIAWDTITLTNGKTNTRHSEIWKFFTKIIPDFYRKDFKLYTVVNNPKDEVFAAVWQDSNDPNLWNLEVNTPLFYKENNTFDTSESLHTLIHEFSHVLTLGKTQVDYLPQDIQSPLSLSRFKERCKSDFITEWCLKSWSYLEAFIKSFWKKEDVSETENNQKDVLTWHESEFVTDYAATNPAEDIAESFTYFVLQPKPKWESTAEKKINFFYQFKNLVDLRIVIRNRLN